MFRNLIRHNLTWFKYDEIVKFTVVHGNDVRSRGHGRARGKVRFKFIEQRCRLDFVPVVRPALSFRTDNKRTFAPTLLIRVHSVIFIVVVEEDAHEGVHTNKIEMLRLVHGVLWGVFRSLSDAVARK